MANLKFTLKRNNGSGYDTLLPRTVFDQIYTNDTYSVTLDSHLQSTYVPLSQKGVASGVATLDSSGLIPSSQLGAYIRGGIKIQGSMGALSTDTVGELLSILETIVSNSNGAVTREELIGYAWIASTDFLFTEGTLPANTAYVISPHDDNETDLPYNVEASDMLLVTGYTFTGGTTHTWDLAFINNKQGNATADHVGLVQLMSPSTTTTGGNSSKVVTEQILSNLIGTGAGSIAAGDHTHSGYQAADSDLTTLAGLTHADGSFIVSNGTSWTTESGGTARDSLGLGALAVRDNINNAYWSGLDLSVENGGTGASDASAARGNLGLAIGTDVQAYHANLDSISGYSAGKLAAIDNLAVQAGLASVNGDMIYYDTSEGKMKMGSSGAVRTALHVYSTAEVDDLLNNRPEIFYDTTTGAGAGDLIIDID